MYWGFCEIPLSIRGWSSRGWGRGDVIPESGPRGWWRRFKAQVGIGKDDDVRLSRIFGWKRAGDFISPTER